MTQKPPRSAAKGKETVLVGLSGGMKSAVTAALLKNQGYHVIAFHLAMADPKDPISARFGAECAGQPDPSEVKKLCEKLDIPLHLGDARAEFREAVVDRSVHEALQGRMASPCVTCHMEIRLQHIFAAAERLQPDWIATGHHVQVLHGDGRNPSRLMRGTEAESDQSHLLFQLRQEQLARLMTPLGSIPRAMVRRMATEFRVPISQAGHSRDWCGIKRPGFGAMVESLTPLTLRPIGSVVTASGSIAGQHGGIFNFYVGQCDNIPTEMEMSDDFCVIGIDPRKNNLIVGDRGELLKQRVIAKRAHWISPVDGLRETRCLGQAGPGGKTGSCSILHFENDMVHVVFDEGQSGLVPGQNLVFYEGDEVLGGAWIDRVDG